MFLNFTIYFEAWIVLSFFLIFDGFEPRCSYKIFLKIRMHICMFRLLQSRALTCIIAHVGLQSLTGALVFWVSISKLFPSISLFGALAFGCQFQNYFQVKKFVTNTEEIRKNFEVLVQISKYHAK